MLSERARAVARAACGGEGQAQAERRNAYLELGMKKNRGFPLSQELRALTGIRDMVGVYGKLGRLREDALHGRM